MRGMNRVWQAAGTVASVLRPGLLERAAEAVQLDCHFAVGEIEALLLDPAEAGVHGSLGRAQFIARGDFLAASREFERALELNPQAGWYALQLAHCAALLGDFPKAEAAARRAAVLEVL